MITFQDLLDVGPTDEERIEFTRRVIEEHQHSDKFKTAEIAQEYDRRQNHTIMEYQKLLYTIDGITVPDNYSANHKLCANFFERFITQENQYLLGNGVSWQEDSTRDALGKDFDSKLQKAGRYALVDGESFGFWNYDHVDVFRITEYAPLLDEEDGAMKAGVRFWQLSKSKPLRATLYELDGYTEFIWRPGEKSGEVLRPKRAYILKIRSSVADGMEIYDSENYPTFPIVPFYGNPHKESELVGRRENIDAYDLIKSGFANDVDDASLIYWTINNAGGMDDVDLSRFLDHMRRVKAAVVEEQGATAESHTIDVPYGSREAVLERIRNDLYEDFMALDTQNIASGAATATQIRASYEPLNNKTDLYEYCVIDFIQGILALAGIEDSPSFTRSTIVNVAEEVNTVLAASDYLGSKYITEKVLTYLGDGDKLEDVLAEVEEEEISRYESAQGNEQGTEENGEAPNEDLPSGV